MNSREKVVLLTLTVMFLLGTGISLIKRSVLRRQADRFQLVVQTPLDSQTMIFRKVDLNRATRYQLEALPGIGPVIATRIIQYREQHRGFRSIAELRCISGIGPKRFAALKELVAIGTETDDTMTNRFKVDSMAKRIKD